MLGNRSIDYSLCPEEILLNAQSIQQSMLQAILLYTDVVSS